MKTTFPHFLWPISRLGSYHPFLGKLSCCCICIIGVCGCVSFKGYTGTQSWISQMSQRWEDLPNKATLEDDILPVADPDQGFRRKSNMGAPKRSSLAQKVVCDNRCVSHKSGYLL